MDSRIIFESAKTYIQTVTWIKPKIDAESEWIHIGINNNAMTIENIIKDYFITDELFVALTRNKSFESDKETITYKIQPLIGIADFTIWDWSFQKVLEFNKIGVYRTGINASH